jgi:hypothetical protein
MSSVVQAEAWGLMSRFGLFTSPTNNIVEEMTPDICLFAGMFLIRRQRSTQTGEPLGRTTQEHVAQ